MKLESKKIKDSLIWVLIFLAAMNFYAKFFYFTYMVLLAMMIFGKSIKANAVSCWYLIFGGFMAIYAINDGALALLRCFAYVIFYWVGYSLIQDAAKCHSGEGARVVVQKRAQYVLTAVTGGSFAHYMINFFSMDGGIVDRNTIDIWTGKPIAATLQAAMAYMMIGLAIAMILHPQKKASRWLGLLFLVCALAYNLVLAGRTMFVVIFVVLISGLFYVAVQEKKSSKAIKLLAWMMAVLIIIALVFALNIGGIRETIMNSNLFQRFEGDTGDELLEGGRTEKQLQYLKHLWEYPFGGGNMQKQFGYAHFLLLDVYDDYGIFAVIVLMIMLIHGIVQLCRLCKRKPYDLSCKLSFLCVYISILLCFCVEPIFAGMNWFFVCYCLINGCIAGMNSSSVKRRFLQ